MFYCNQYQVFILYTLVNIYKKNFRLSVYTLGQERFQIRLFRFEFGSEDNI